MTEGPLSPAQITNAAHSQRLHGVSRQNLREYLVINLFPLFIFLKTYTSKEEEDFTAEMPHRPRPESTNIVQIPDIFHQ